MQKQVINLTTQSIGISAFGEEALIAIFELRWMLVAIVVMVISDFWFGVSESINLKKDKFRFSRAGRRTTAKLIEYITYVVVGCVIGLAITEPLGICSYVTSSAIALSLAFVWETDSIAGHVCKLHGLRPTLSIKRILIAIIKKKNKDVGEAIEDVIEGTDDEKGKR